MRSAQQSLRRLQKARQEETRRASQGRSGETAERSEEAMEDSPRHVAIHVQAFRLGSGRAALRRTAGAAGKFAGPREGISEGPGVNSRIGGRTAARRRSYARTSAGRQSFTR